MDKFKIQVILRSSPEKTFFTNIRQRNYRFPINQQGQQGVFYGRSPSSNLPQPDIQENVINLRQKIVNPKQCLIRPTSKKQKQSQMFTQKCLQILSKKKAGVMSEHKTKIHSMMSHVVDKYKKVINYNKSELMMKNNLERSLTQPKTQGGYSQMNAYQDRIQVYRTIKSTQIPKTTKQASTNKQQNKPDKKQITDWRAKPDVTGVRMNNRILKSHTADIQGVKCFSLAISEVPLVKRQSLMLSHQITQIQQEPRAASSGTYRRKISIGRVNTQKFMAFSMSSDIDGLYMKKLKSFLDFLFKINYSNKIYVPLNLTEDTVNLKKYKVYIGRGNNSLLVKSLLKRRFWLEIVDDVDQQGINFYWTQNKINKVQYRQTISKNVKKQRQLVKKKQIKEEERETVQLNKKILAPEECLNVQNYICKDGFFMPQPQKYVCTLITNHIPRNSSIGSKKNLFKSLFYYFKEYVKADPFDYIPKTYNVKGPDDVQFKKFLKQYENQSKKVWIVKPGQNSNRGNGIRMAQTAKVIDLIRRKEKHHNGQTKTFILQSYIDRPFLYNGRKFDIRHYMMITSVNGIMKAYWYKEGYIRTSSEKYDIQDLDNEQIHLTNDAIQKKYDQYQKYEPGNKLSYPEFQRYLDLTYPNKSYNFQRDIVSKMRMIILDVIKANFNILDKNRRQCNFQIFGFDFMIDRQFKPWLIQINFNPCLEINCPVLSRIIPIMVENSLRIGLDPLLPPQNHYPGNKRFSLTDNYLKNLKYQLLFDELTFDQSIPIYHDIEDSDDEQEQYVDEGKEIDELVNL